MGDYLLDLINKKDGSLNKKNRLYTILHLAKHFASDYIYKLFDQLLLY